MRVFVNRTIKLFLDMGGVSDHKRSGWPYMVHMPQVINAVRPRININPVKKQKNHGSANGYCAENHGLHYQIRLGSFKQQTGQCLTVALKENRKKNKDACCHCTVKSVTKNSSLHMKKIFTVEETFNKQNDRVYAQLFKEAHELVPRIE